MGINLQEHDGDIDLYEHNPILIATGVCVSSCLFVRPRQITSHVADKFERREEVLRETACPFKVFRRILSRNSQRKLCVSR